MPIKEIGDRLRITASDVPSLDEKSVSRSEDGDESEESAQGEHAPNAHSDQKGGLNNHRQYVIDDGIECDGDLDEQTQDAVEMDEDDEERNSGHEHAGNTWRAINGTWKRHEDPATERVIKFSRTRSIAFSADTDRFRRLVNASFTADYLELLNTDIDDAAAQCVAPLGFNGNDVAAEKTLRASQIGLAEWTVYEKTVFFEALARLGPDNVPGIAARVETKSVMDVAAYLRLLCQGSQTTGYKARSVFVLGDAPAAAEISPACCAALEAAADGVAAREERREDEKERKRWGGEWWLLRPDTLAALGANVPPALREEFELFHIKTWLKLSERVFLNATVPDGNWKSVAEVDKRGKPKRPAIRATALRDFYALMLSITQRIMSAAMYMAETRIKGRSHTKRQVSKCDVYAAVLSLGLSTDKHDFWENCPRRLKLNVVDEEDEGDESEAMMCNVIDEALDLGGDELEDEVVTGDKAQSTTAYEPNLLPIDGKSGSELEDEIEFEEAVDEAIRGEADEVVFHSAQDLAFNRSRIKALMRRIQRDHQHEAFADALDARATHREEKRLWDAVGQNPPQKLVKPKLPQSPIRSRHTIEEFYPAGGDWRAMADRAFVPDWVTDTAADKDQD